MNDKCPHCWSNPKTHDWSLFKCGTANHDMAERSNLCKEIAISNRLANELAATKRELTAIRRRLNGEQTESCPLCAEMRCSGESQSVPMCHVCTLESKLEETKRELEENLTVFRAWTKAFGTSQLTHAKARLETAESRANRAESRVRELEGLQLGNYITGQLGIWLEVLLPPGIKYDSRLCRTLGEAMPGGEK